MSRLWLSYQLWPQRTASSLHSISALTWLLAESQQCPYDEELFRTRHHRPVAITLLTAVGFLSLPMTWRAVSALTTPKSLPCFHGNPSHVCPSTAVGWLLMRWATVLKIWHCTAPLWQLTHVFLAPGCQLPLCHSWLHPAGKALDGQHRRLFLMHQLRWCWLRSCWLSFIL